VVLTLAYAVNRPAVFSREVYVLLIRCIDSDCDCDCDCVGHNNILKASVRTMSSQHAVVDRDNEEEEQVVAKSLTDRAVRLLKDIVERKLKACFVSKITSSAESGSISGMACDGGMPQNANPECSESEEIYFCTATDVLSPSLQLQEHPAHAKTNSSLSEENSSKRGTKVSNNSSDSHAILEDIYHLTVLAWKLDLMVNKTQAVLQLQRLVHQLGGSRDENDLLDGNCVSNDGKIGNFIVI
jgi:hypothetical protein